MDFDASSAEASRTVAAELTDLPVRKRARRFALVRVSARIEAAPERVFGAWLDRKIAGKWLFATASRPMTDVAIDARVRGRFRFTDGADGDRIEHSGAYLEILRPRRLAFTLSAGDDLPATRVIAEIAPAGSAETSLTVTHADVPRELAARIEARWMGMLYGLGLLLRRA